MRDRGPRAKAMRRFGVALAPSPKYQRILEKRPNPTFRRTRSSREDGTSGKLVRAPERDEIPVPADDRLIVEFYSR